MRSKGATGLYHANTVHTCCTFLRDGHLLARGVVHERGLDQTEQRSDKLDRALGIWYDIFFDAVDIHVQSSKVSYYGPVLLKFDLSILAKDWLPNVWIAKSNPISWDVDTPNADRWFTSIEELERLYKPTNFGFHIVLRNVGGNVRLLPYLESVVVDNPERTLAETPARFAIDMCSAAVGALIGAARAGKLLGKGIHNSVRTTCPPHCGCKSYYKSMSNTQLRKNFLA